MAKSLSKVEQIARLFDHIKGKRVHINPDGRNWIATPNHWSGSYLTLIDVKDGASGLSLMNKTIHATEIDRIEILPQPKNNK